MRDISDAIGEIIKTCHLQTRRGQIQPSFVAGVKRDVWRGEFCAFMRIGSPEITTCSMTHKRIGPGYLDYERITAKNVHYYQPHELSQHERKMSPWQDTVQFIPSGSAVAFSL